MQIRLALFFLSAVVLFGNLPIAATATQESKERVIRRMPVEQNEPLSITDIKVNGRNVSFDKKFVADDDWMRSLVISVKNKSDKLILLASLDLFFPRTPGSKDLLSVFEMFHGNWALQRKPPTADERLVGIAPGETVEIGFSVQKFVDLQQFLTDAGYSPSIEKVDLRISRVIFDDDTMWYAGGPFHRDPKDPRSWINSPRANAQPH